MINSSLVTSPFAKAFLIFAFSSLGRPLDIGPAGIKTTGRYPNDKAPIKSPGIILSHIPKHSPASNILCDKPIAVDMAITSLLINDNSIPFCP